VLLCKLTSFVKKGYFNAIVLVFMGVRCGYSPLTKLRIYASRGVKLKSSLVLAEYVSFLFSAYIKSMFTFVR